MLVVRCLRWNLVSLGRSANVIRSGKCCCLVEDDMRECYELCPEDLNIFVDVVRCASTLLKEISKVLFRHPLISSSITSFSNKRGIEELWNVELPHPAIMSFTWQALPRIVIEATVNSILATIWSVTIASVSSWLEGRNMKAGWHTCGLGPLIFLSSWLDCKSCLPTRSKQTTHCLYFFADRTALRAFARGLVRDWE